MNTNERNGIRMLGMLVIFSLCCIAMVPGVAAIYPNDKWLTDNRTVFANTSDYGTINGVVFTNNYFFGVVGNSHFNGTQEAWNWTGDSRYSDRYYLEQLNVANASGEFYYPASVGPSDWQWEFVNNLTPTATIYKKGLGGYVNPESGTYYIWYGNKTAAYITYNNHTNWLVPSYENSTYMVNLTETWDD